MMDKLDPAGRVYGMPMYENRNLTVTKSRPRTRRERWLSWPWCPWRKLHVWQEPDPDFYVMRRPFVGTESIVAHPMTAKKLRDTLAGT